MKGQKITGKFVVVNSIVKETSTKKPYFLLDVVGTEGKQVGAKIWSNSIVEGSNPQAGDVIVIEDGIMDEYKGMAQLIINTYKVIQDNEFVQTVIKPPDKNIPVEKLYSEMFFDFTFKNKEIGAIVKSIGIDNEFEKKFKDGICSAVVHHNYKGGLCIHTYECYMIAKMISDTVFKNRCDRDLLIAGCILHDVGCAFTHEFNLEYQKNSDGILLGHVIVGANFVQKIGESIKCSGESLQKLIHIIISHMGKLEWGSPITPKTIEAELVHLCDMMSSQVGVIERATEEMSGKIMNIGITNSIFDRFFGEIYIK